MTKETAVATESEASGAIDALPPEVETIRVTYSDLHGVQRGKDVPRTEFVRAATGGLAFCWAVMGTDLRHVPVVGGESGYPDMTAYADLSTLRQLPWEPDVAACLSDLVRDEAPEPTDQRALVRRAEEALGELGLTGKVGPELEFYLCTRDGDGPWQRHVDNLSMVYTVGPQADPTGIVKSMLNACAQLGLGVDRLEPRVHEQPVRDQSARVRAAGRRGQLLSLQVRDQGSRRARQASTQRSWASRSTTREGPASTSISRSSATATNCFDESSDDSGLSQELRYFVGGILEHAKALMAFLNPTINAYRRILPDSLAPINVNWGMDNRTTFVRIPPERGGGSRVELRVGDGAANPHLVIAACLFAGIDGIKRKVDPGPPLEGDAYALPPEEQGRSPPLLASGGHRRAGRQTRSSAKRSAPTSSTRSPRSRATRWSATTSTSRTGTSTNTSITSR